MTPPPVPPAARCRTCGEAPATAWLQYVYPVCGPCLKEAFARIPAGGDDGSWRFKTAGGWWRQLDHPSA